MRYVKQVMLWLLIAAMMIPGLAIAEDIEDAVAVETPAAETTVEHDDDIEIAADAVEIVEEAVRPEDESVTVEEVESEPLPEDWAGRVEDFLQDDGEIEENLPIDLFGADLQSVYGVTLTQQSSIQSLTTNSVEIFAAITVRNTNSYSVRITAAGAGLFLDGKAIDVYSLSQNYTLAARSTHTFYVTIRFSGLRASTSYQYMCSATVSGSLTGATPLGSFKTKSAPSAKDYVQVTGSARVTEVNRYSATIECDLTIKNNGSSTVLIECSTIAWFLDGEIVDVDMEDKGKQLAGGSTFTTHDTFEIMELDAETTYEYMVGVKVNEDLIPVDQIFSFRTKEDFDVSIAAPEKITKLTHDSAEVVIDFEITNTGDRSVTLTEYCIVFEDYEGSDWNEIQRNPVYRILVPGETVTSIQTFSIDGLKENHWYDYQPFVVINGEECDDTRFDSGVAYRFQTLERIRVQSITLTEQEVEFDLSQSWEPVTVIATVLPEEADSSVTWTSSNTNVATVTTNGVIAPVAYGTAVITCASRENPSVSASVNVSVDCSNHNIVVDHAVAPTGFTSGLTEGSHCSVCKKVIVAQQVVPELAHTLHTGSNGTYTVNVGDKIYFRGDANYTIKSWKSSSTKVASIVANGTITTKAEGTVTITGTFTNKKKATVKVKVVDPYKPSSVSLNLTGTQQINVDEVLNLQPILQPATAIATFSWKSSDTKIATVSNGTVLAKKAGTVTITVTATRGKVKKSASIKVKVVDPFVPTSVSLNLTGTQQLNLGETMTLTPTLLPATAKATFTWKSSDAKIASVSNGVVTPKKPGTVTITVTATRGKTKKTASVKIKVVDPNALQGITLNVTGTQSLVKGDTLQLSVNPIPEAATGTATWATSNKKVATVSKGGLVTAKGKGTAKITVTYTRGKIKKTVSVKITVTNS